MRSYRGRLGGRRERREGGRGRGSKGEGGRGGGGGGGKAYLQLANVAQPLYKRAVAMDVSVQPSLLPFFQLWEEMWREAPDTGITSLYL